jgi:hypothetical protein
VNRKKTRIAAAATVLGLGGLTGIALSAGGRQANTLADKPLIHTKVIHRTVHVTKHLKPKHPVAGGSAEYAGSTSGGAPAAVTASSGASTSEAAPVTTATSGKSAGETAPVTTASSGTGGGGEAAPVTTGPSGTGGGGEAESEGDGGGD